MVRQRGRRVVQQWLARSKDKTLEADHDYRPHRPQPDCGCSAHCAAILDSRMPCRRMWETWETELGRAAIARHNFQLACIRGLRRTPATEVEEPYG